MKEKKYPALRFAYDHPISIFGRLYWFYQSIVRPKRYADIKEDIELLKFIHSLPKLDRKGGGKL